MTDIYLGHAVLTYLDEYRAHYRKTKQVLAGIQAKNVGSFTSTTHIDVRNCLNKLHACGAVERKGSGSFLWKIIVTSWDKYAPFKKLPTAPSKVNNDPPAHTHDKWVEEPKKEDNTEWLKYKDLIDSMVTINVGMMNKLKTQEAEIEELRQRSASTVRVLELRHYDGKVTKLKGKVFPRVFDRVLSLARCRRNIMLVGPAGCGKTYLAKLISEALSLDFGSVSCTAGMSETHLLGRVVPDLMKGENVFQGASFLDCFEDGGVYLLDELDAADPNLLLCINTALANGYCNVPNRRKKPRAVRHQDFVCIGTANTFGRGATRQYAGRNQLDEATLDRFRIGIVECDYDPIVESAVCPDIGGQDGRKYVAEPRRIGDTVAEKISELGYNLRETCHYVRDKIEKSGMRRIMSTRFMEDAYVMMKEGGWNLKEVMEAYLEGWSAEEKAKLY